MSYQLAGKRSRDMAAVAAANRLTFSVDDPHGCARRPYTLFTQTPAIAATNVLTGRLHGVTVHGFDFPYQFSDTAARAAGAGSPGGPPMVGYDDRPHGCAAVYEPLSTPWVHLSPRGGRRARLANGAEMPLGDPKLARLFTAWSDQPELADEVLRGTVAELLVGTKGQFTFEWDRGGVVAIVGNIRPEDFPAFMAMTVRLHGVLGEMTPALVGAGRGAPAPAAVPAAPVATPPPAPPQTARVAASTLPPPPPDAASAPLPPAPPDAASAPLPPPPRS